MLGTFFMTEIWRIMAKMSVSARTVDMLGRQQIAGIPTAIHELFKNAHDAYAKNVEIDFYQDHNLLTLRDDGIGMTESDFDNKWLTIGTSSKFGNNRKSDYIPRGMSERKLMGEKGIGRLAIASIGRQVVVLSRAERNDGLHDMVVALIHWSQFEIPDISVSDIVIPTRTFPSGVLPKSADLLSMSQEIISNLDKLGNKVSPYFSELITNDLKLLTFSPDVLFENLQKRTSENWESNIQESRLEDSHDKPILDGIGKGTHFIIMPCDEALKFDVKKDFVGTTELQKILVGFSNSLSNEKGAVLQSKFRLHQGASKPEELIEEGFFTLQDAKDADHFIEGEFDEYGQFRGDVTVFKGDPQSHIINWNDNFGNKTRCGPFKIKFAYLQGDPSDSLVPSNVYTDIKSKLAKYGGLYLYKDGIRVLPYGKQEFDFLRFEEKRSKRASHAFFSYRLMFGAIEIEHDINRNLIEKAGREGLIENIAYREFKEILANFFDQLAADFFRDTSINERFSEIKNALKEEARAEKALLDKRRKQSSNKKKELEKNLSLFFSELEEESVKKRVENLINDFDSEISKSNFSWGDYEKYNFISNLRNSVRNDINHINKSIRITRPNIGLNKELREDWESYLKNKQLLSEGIIQPASEYIESQINSYVNNNGLSFSLRDRVVNILDSEKKALNKNISSYRDEIKLNVTEIDSEIKNKTRVKSIEFSNSMSEILAKINATPIDTLSEDESVHIVTEWEKELETLTDDAEEYFSKMRDTIEFILDDIKDDSSSSIDMIAALESENEKVKESLNQYFDFAQLGMSIGIVQHEFGSTARNVRESIKSLKPWAEKNPSFDKLYKNIRNSFSHLDNYLGMFTPLNRRLYRTKVSLSGREIENYLRDIFEERMLRSKIELKVSDDFRAKITEVYPSTFLPVFINVVDNAIHWLNSKDKNDRKYISLDVNGEDYTIFNNGPAIAAVDRDRIFDFSFSRKKNGRGMGLYICKETLNREGFDIVLDESEVGTSPRFSIKKLVLENE